MWEGDFRTIGVEIKFFYTNGTDNGEGKPLCTCTKLMRRIICKYGYIYHLLIYNLLRLYKLMVWQSHDN